MTLFNLMAVFFLIVNPNECDFRPSLQLDSRLIEIKDEASEMDTLILYRHWVYTNGENGYGRAIGKKKNKIFRKDLKFVSDSSSILESEWYELSSFKPSLNPFQLFSKIDSTESDLLKSAGVMVSHDGLHTIAVYSQNKRLYCDEKPELSLLPNKELSKIEFIYSLRDTNEFTPLLQIDGKRVEPEGQIIHFLDGEPIFEGSKKTKRRLRRQYRQRIEN